MTGDLEDTESLDAAMRGVTRVYSVQTFTGPDGVEGEERQGKAVADAAVRAGVSHFVYGSVGGADRGSGVPHFDSKGGIEQYLDKLDLPVSVLQPAMFISNFTMIGPARTDGALVLSLALEPDTALQMITTEDIGFFAADAFEDPDRYLGRKTEIAARRADRCADGRHLQPRLRRALHLPPAVAGGSALLQPGSGDHVRLVQPRGLPRGHPGAEEDPPRYDHLGALGTGELVGTGPDAHSRPPHGTAAPL